MSLHNWVVCPGFTFCFYTNPAQKCWFKTREFFRIFLINKNSAHLDSDNFKVISLPHNCENSF
jgi:hypothetical protein